MQICHLVASVAAQTGIVSSLRLRIPSPVMQAMLFGQEIVLAHPLIVFSFDHVLSRILLAFLFPEIDGMLKPSLP
jgi:hypothetical protein